MAATPEEIQLRGNRHFSASPPVFTTALLASIHSLSLSTGNFNTADGAGALLSNTADENTATGAGAL